VAGRPLVGNQLQRKQPGKTRRTVFPEEVPSDLHWLLSLRSGNIEQPLEVRRLQNSLHLRAAVDNPYIGGISTNVLAQHKQHAQRGTVHVFRPSQIDHITFPGPALRVRITKLLVHREAELPGDTDRYQIAILGHVH